MLGNDQLRRRNATTLCLVVLAVVVTLTCRLLWLGSRTETGLQALRWQWRDDTVGLLAGRQVPVPFRSDADQDEFWLKEVERVLDRSAESADIAMGAALVLDSAPADLRFDQIAITGFPGWVVFPDLDDVPPNGERVLEAKRNERCLQLAKRATELEPSNPELWRIRAMLAGPYFPGGPYFDVRRVRDPNWLSVLEDCARHDPENGLYDYLAALFYWEGSVNWRLDDKSDLYFVVTDVERFELGTRCFEEGQQKRHVSLADSRCLSSVLSFLDYVRLSPLEHPQVVNNVRFCERSFRTFVIQLSFLFNLLRLHSAQSDQAVGAGHPHRALKLQRQMLRVVSQLRRGSFEFPYKHRLYLYEAITLKQIRLLAQEHGHLTSDDELAKLKKREESALLINALHAKALRSDSFDASRSTSWELLAFGLNWFAGSPAEFFGTSLVAVAPRWLMLLSVISLAAFVCGGFRARNAGLPTVGATAQSTTLATALVGTFVVLGLAPAKILNDSVQGWTITVFLIAAAGVLVPCLAWKWLRRRRYRVGLRTVLALMSAICLVLALMSWNRKALRPIVRIPLRLSIPTIGWNGDFDALSATEYWALAVSQWTNYYGPYVTIAVWLTIVAVLLRFRLRKWTMSGKLTSPTLKSHWIAYCRSLVRPSLASAVILCLAYLLLTPMVLDIVDRKYQLEMSFARNPDRYWGEIEQTIHELQSDSAFMARLKNEVQQEMARE